MRCVIAYVHTAQTFLEKIVFIECFLLEVSCAVFFFVFLTMLCCLFAYFSSDWALKWLVHEDDYC